MVDKPVVLIAEGAAALLAVLIGLADQWYCLGVASWVVVGTCNRVSQYAYVGCLPVVGPIVAALINAAIEAEPSVACATGAVLSLIAIHHK